MKCSIYRFGSYKLYNQ